MDEEGGAAASAGPKLPDLPAEGMDIGVLPRVIRTLVERRSVVKKMLKKEKVRGLLRAYYIRQYYHGQWEAGGPLGGGVHK